MHNLVSGIYNKGYSYDARKLGEHTWERLSVEDGNGRKFHFKNGTRDFRLVSGSDQITAFGAKNLPVEAEIINDGAWKAFCRWRNLSEAAGPHRILDDLVHCRSYPSPGKIARYVDTSHEAWKRFKEVYKKVRNSKKFPQKELLKLFELFNQCVKK